MTKKLFTITLLLPLVWIGLSAGAPGYWQPEEKVKASVKRIVLPLNKAAVIDLPTDAHDVLVSSPDIVDAVIRTPRKSYLMGKQIGQANAFYFDEKGDQILRLEIRVERDVTVLESLFKKFLPDTEISAEAVNDNIVLTGTVRSAAQAKKARDLAGRFVEKPEQVLSMLSVETGEQVLLKVKIVEMQRSLAKQFGIDLATGFSAGGEAYGLVTANPFGLGKQLFDSQVFGSFQNDAPCVPVQGIHPSVSAACANSGSGVLKALESTGMLRTLAEPNLTAISGESATFLAGGEFPIPTSRDRDGNITLEFKQFGVSLNFTPVVLDGGRISLKLSTEVSDITSDNAFEISQGVVFDSDNNPVVIPGATIPALNVRRAQTTVELPSGGSMAIAGLLQDNFKQAINGIPGIKDMPVLGALARSRDFQNNQTEMVVIVTPYLAGPVNEKQLATPTDKYIPPSDLDSILFQRLNTVYGKKNVPMASQKMNGPYGYIVK